MGGNALKNVPTRRYAVDEYNVLVQEVMSHLNRAKTRAWRYEVIPAYYEKEDFGDMDVLYATDDNVPFDVEVVKYIFSPNEIVRNTSVISFDYKGFQIDLIHSKTEDIDYAISYFSWNDCGNLVGKLAHQLGLKHGHRGLTLPMRDDNNVFHELLLTDNHSKALQFLGLDVEKFTSGFNNLEEIFDFVAASPYYNPDSYKLENLNNVAKTRDRKRDTYNKFLAFGEAYTGSRFIKLADKSVFLTNILNYFDVQDEFSVVMRNMSLQKLAKEKFNGDIINRITGYNAGDLGKFIKYLKDTGEFSQSMVVYLSQDQIEKRIRLLFESYEIALHKI